MIAGFAFRTEQPGIVTRHVFSAGGHYDPDRLSCGPVVGCDEHTVEPGAGFGRHAHRGVVIVSWVLEGALCHEDDSGARVVRPGEVLVQSAGNGIRHTERNASDSAPLRFVQTTLLVDAEPSVTASAPPVTLPGGAVFDIVRDPPTVLPGLAVPLDDATVLVVRFGR